MEARFVILHPDDPAEILLATPLIRCIRTQVEGALVYSAVKKEHLWLLSSNPFLEELFVYQEKPDELLEDLRNFLPDYLIDLDGSRITRRLKGQLKVLDFTINRLNFWEPWSQRAFKTGKLFDVTDDGKGSQLIAAPLDTELLPSDFLDGYLILSLDNAGKSKRLLTDEQIIELAVLTEKPIVVTGNSGDRDLANRIGQASGCAVFPTCGDLTYSQIGSLLSHARGSIVFNAFWDQVAAALGKETFFITENSTLSDRKDIALWARSLFNIQP